MHKALDDPEKAIMRAFLLANAWLTKQADEVYKRYFGDGSYAEAEIETILNQSITQDQLSELLVLIKSEDNKAVKKDMQRLVSAMAAKSRITQAELLRAKAEVVARQIGAIEQQQMDDFYVKTIQDAYNQASAEALIGQSKHDLKLPGNVEAKAKPGGVQFIDPDTDKVVKSVDFTPDKPIREFKRMSTSQVDKVMHMNWLGSNYSKRIWKNTDLLADTLKDLFTAQAMSGMSHRDMQRVLQDKFGVGANYARRLIRTEANFVSNQAKLMGYREHGIKEYVLVAVLDFRTSTICRKKDGLHFKVEEAHCDGMHGNYPPFHAWCRTVAVAYFGKETFVGKHLVNNPLGHSFEMPAGTTYREWEQALIDKYGETNVRRAQLEAKTFNEDLKQYREFTVILKEDAPSNLQSFQDVKYTGGRDWLLTKIDYQRRMRLKSEPNLLLPNAENATIAPQKFTKYLFDGENERGLIKGRLITKELGFDIDNYPEFSDEILKRIKMYPARLKSTTPYGNRYETAMIMYGPEHHPVNIVAGWMVGDEETHMSSIMIKEAKE